MLFTIDAYPKNFSRIANNCSCYTFLLYLNIAFVEVTLYCIKFYLYFKNSNIFIELQEGKKFHQKNFFLF